MDRQNPTEQDLIDGLLDKVLKDYKKPEDILGEHGLLKRLSKRILEKLLYLALERAARKGRGR